MLSLLCSVAQSGLTLCDPMDCSSPELPVPHYLPKFVQVHVHCIGDAIQSSHPLMPLLLLPSLFPSIRAFSNELAVSIRWLKHWSSSFGIRPHNEHSGLISLKIDWFALLAVQGTFRSILQHHSFKALVFWHSAFCLQSSSHNHTWPLGRP